jgi:hypothetical protein
MLRTALLLASAATAALGHSWIACSDYRLDEAKMNRGDVSDVKVWDASKCMGFPRNAAQFAKKESFGGDTGYNFQPGAYGPFCGGQTTRKDMASMYAAGYNMATWKAGSRVCMAWPVSFPPISSPR